MSKHPEIDDPMQPKAVQFGAGNIGRGFLAQLFHESGLEVVFVDVAEAVVTTLNERRKYDIEIVGPKASTVPVDNVRAVSGRDLESVATEISEAAIVATAVGANALRSLAPALAAGLLARHNGSGASLNILLCENLHDAAIVLREAVAEALPETERDAILAKTGFVQAVVSRMIPFQQPSANLTIKAEAYKRLPVDGAAIVAPFPKIVGIEPVENFTAWVERKLYVHNAAHALLGYLGVAAGHAYGYEALEDERISALLRAALEETGQALISRHGFDPDEHRSHVADLVERFRNRALGDTCARLARDPVRKLAPDDRLVGAARLCESQGVTPVALAWAIAAALRYDDSADPSAPLLQQARRENGLAAAMERFCHIAPHEPLFHLVVEAMETAIPDDRTSRRI